MPKERAARKSKPADKRRHVTYREAARVDTSKRSCRAGKVAYRGQKAAKAEAKRQSLRGGNPEMYAYECRECEFWHLATRKER